MRKKWMNMILAGSLVGCISPLVMLDANASTQTSAKKGSISAIEIEQLQKDLDIFYDGLDGFPVYSSSHSGGISAIGNNAFVVAVNPDSVPFVGAARYGQGKVVAAGLSEYFDFSTTDEISTKVLSNILKWVTDIEHENPTYSTYAQALKGEEEIKIVTNREIPVNEDLPIQMEYVADFLSVDLDPLEHQVAFVNNFHQPLSDEEVQALLHYVREGGAVIFGEKGWVMEGHPKEWMAKENSTPRLTDYGIQTFLNEVGLSLTNIIATTKTETYPKMKIEKIQNYFVPTLIENAKAIEEGTMDPSTLNIGSDEASPDKKKEIIAQVVSATIGSLIEEHPLLEQMKNDLTEFEVTWPFVKSDYPYSSSLLAYQVSAASLDVNGEKSPYANHFPGAVPQDADMIDNKEVVVDFDYADLSYLRMGYPPGTWMSTELYAPAGEIITIDVPEGVEDLYVQVGSHTDVLTGKPTWSRMPVVALQQKLEPGENQIKSPYGGLIYLIPKTAKSGFTAPIEISGGVSTPTFVKGETTNEEWHRTVKNNPAPWGEIIGEHVIFTLPKETLLELENPAEIIEHWDQVTASYDEFVGIDPALPLPHKGLDRPHRYVADVQISAGYMHAGYPIMIPIDPAAAHVVDPELALERGWGFWHEMGHEYQQNSWKWGDLTEVSVNIYTLYIQEKFTDVQRLIEKSEDGKSHYDRALEFVADPSTTKKYTDLELMDQLVFFKQLQLAFGWDFYTDLHIAYREMDEKELPSTDQEKKDLLLYMTSKQSGYNLVSLFQKWGWSITDNGQAKVDALDLPDPEVAIWELRESNVEDASASLLLDILDSYQANLPERVYHPLFVHLKSVEHFEDKGESEKVVKHMDGFKQVLDDQKEKEVIPDYAYNILKSNANSLIKKWQ
ncbi:hypothetical protein J14TS2_03100 [Bacillus sp. J14TS2]|uniref:M60 family metallopeptidase n=1 Tax=Bacillus sp. J14TS2 TaxID=2807188 RepID=UPI001B1883E3|nr:M60 family metallopeptidase [Bacillus sp. J14TS2]GIN69835.1 hypothetical protein J14TS2_03100 [Bacillus sp. J14TS2]